MSNNHLIRNFLRNERLRVKVNSYDRIQDLGLENLGLKWRSGKIEDELIGVN